MTAKNQGEKVSKLKAKTKPEKLNLRTEIKKHRLKSTD